VLCALIIEEALRCGDRCIDFLGADEPWKREWTSEVQAHSWLYVFRPGLRTLLARTAKFTLAPLLRDRVVPLLPRRGRAAPAAAAGAAPVAAPKAVIAQGPASEAGP
jgi:CelD/BcsL family acetyltransferase involved in cellulose biosynthesis